MAEVKYESKVTRALANAEDVYAVLSDLSNLEKVRDLIPQDKIKEMEFDQDYARFKVDGLGQKVCIRIVEREPEKTVKFGVENIPVQASMWIQMKQMGENDTRLRLTIKADMPVMFKMMLDKKMQEGIDQAADMLAQMPYQQWRRQS